MTALNQFCRTFEFLESIKPNLETEWNGRSIRIWTNGCAVSVTYTDTRRVLKHSVADKCIRDLAIAYYARA